MARKIAKPFRITNGGRFRLKDIDPPDTLEFKDEDKPRAKEALATGIEALTELQDKLYAQDRRAVLLIFQAMEAAGKDGAIKHVMSGVNPQGCQVYSCRTRENEMTVSISDDQHYAEGGTPKSATGRMGSRSIQRHGAWCEKPTGHSSEKATPLGLPTAEL